MFFTLFYAVYDRRTSELTWCGGGHPPSLVMRAGGGHDWLPSQNMVIGAIPDMDAQIGTIKLAPGDRLFVFSDGVFELKTTAGEMWDYDEFQEFMSRPLDPDEDRIDTLRAKGRELMGSEQFEDDFSILEIDFH